MATLDKNLFNDEVSLLARALVETSRQPLLILDSSLRVLTANKCFYKMFHISSAETDGRFLFDLGNGQWDIPKLRKLLEQILPQQQEVNDFEVTHSFPSIGERVVVVNARTLIQAPGEPPLIFLALEDATKRVIRVNELETSRDFAEGIIETLRDPLLILDTNLNVVAANAAFCKSFSSSLDETEGRKIYDWNNRSLDIPELRTLLDNTLLSNSAFRDFELDHVFPGVGRKTLLLNGRRLHEKGKGTENILLVIEDVTERRRQEGFIRFQADALNRVNDAVIAVDNFGRFTYWNSRAERLLNIPEGTKDEIKLDDICTRIEGDSPGALFAISSDDEPWREYRVMLQDSEDEFYLESSAMNNFETDGSVAGRLIVLRDVTKKTKAEIALKRKNEELEFFTSIASHDLQEPLRMVTMYMELLAKDYEGRLDENADSYIRFAVDGAKRMKLLIDDLLRYARVQTGAEKYGRLALRRVVDDVAVDLQVSITEADAKLEVDDLPVIIGDEGQMRQVFQNLIGNAIKYRSSKRAPVIKVAVEKNHSEWVVSVKDNGAGFDMAYAERVFKPFQRLNTRTSESGTGIGLTITKKIVEAHGGCIWAESNPDSGSTFFFTLPR